MSDIEQANSRHKPRNQFLDTPGVLAQGARAIFEIHRAVKESPWLVCDPFLCPKWGR